MSYVRSRGLVAVMEEMCTNEVEYKEVDFEAHMRDFVPVNKDVEDIQGDIAFLESEKASLEAIQVIIATDNNLSLEALSLYHIHVDDACKRIGIPSSKLPAMECYGTVSVATEGVLKSIGDGIMAAINWLIEKIMGVIDWILKLVGIRKGDTKKPTEKKEELEKAQTESTKATAISQINNPPDPQQGLEGKKKANIDALTPERKKEYQDLVEKRDSLAPSTFDPNRSPDDTREWLKSILLVSEIENSSKENTAVVAIAEGKKIKKGKTPTDSKPKLDPKAKEQAIKAVESVKALDINMVFTSPSLAAKIAPCGEIFDFTKFDKSKMSKLLDAIAFCAKHIDKALTFELAYLKKIDGMKEGTKKEISNQIAELPETIHWMDLKDEKELYDVLSSMIKPNPPEKRPEHGNDNVYGDLDMYPLSAQIMTLSFAQIPTDDRSGYHSLFEHANTVFNSEVAKKVHEVQLPCDISKYKGIDDAAAYEKELGKKIEGLDSLLKTTAKKIKTSSTSYQSLFDGIKQRLGSSGVFIVEEHHKANVKGPLSFMSEALRFCAAILKMLAVAVTTIPKLSFKTVMSDIPDATIII